MIVFNINVQKYKLEDKLLKYVLFCILSFVNKFTISQHFSVLVMSKIDF